MYVLMIYDGNFFVVYLLLFGFLSYFFFKYWFFFMKEEWGLNKESVFGIRFCVCFVFIFVKFFFRYIGVDIYCRVLYIYI